jgi:hypothetical protein
MRGDTSAATLAIIAEAVIPAHDLIALDVTQAEWNPAVITNITCRSD